MTIATDIAVAQMRDRLDGLGGDLARLVRDAYASGYADGLARAAAVEAKILSVDVSADDVVEAKILCDHVSADDWHDWSADTCPPIISQDD